MDPRATAAPRVTTVSAIQRYKELSHRLYGEEPGPMGPPSNIEFLKVKILRAKGLKFALAERQTPQVVVTLNGVKRRSPKGKAFGANPVFDWTADFRHHGEETHLVFEVVAGTRTMGVATIPTTPIRQAGSLHRVLPLMYNGIVAGLENAPGDLSELSVSIECIPAQGGGDIPSHNPRVLKARKLCKQLRVTVKSAIINMNEYSETEPYTLNPCVHVSLGGPQQFSTPVAFRVLNTDSEEFVFAHPNRMCECGGIMRGRNEYYEPPPMPAQPGSVAMKGYRKRINDKMQLDYKDVRFTFWYTEQESLELTVKDDHVLLADDLLVNASVDIDELFALAYEGTGEFPSLTTTGMVRKPLKPLDLQLKEYPEVTPVVGEIEFEVEFIQDPLGCPSSFEPLYRRLATMRRSSQDAHYLALGAVDAVISAQSIENLMQSVPLDLRLSLADVVVGAMILSIREVVLHEEDGSFCQERVGKAVQELGIVLQMPPASVEDYDALGRSCNPSLPLARHAEIFNEKCNQMQIDPLIPPLALIAEFMVTRQGYAATVRCGIRDAINAIAMGRYNGAHAFGMLERFVLKSLDVVITGFSRLDYRCLSSAELLAASRELEDAERHITAAELESNITHGKKEIAKFFPTIDPGLLLQKSTMHPGDSIVISKDSKRSLLGGSVAMGWFAGLAGGFGVQETAKMIHGIDDQFFCNPKYHTGLGINKYICRFLRETPADEIIANFLATNKGFVLFFWIYFVLFTWGTYNRLTKRFSRLHELALEPLSSSLSPHAIICVSGFLMSRSDVYLPWQVSEKYPWTDAQVYAVRFETDALLLLGKAFDSVLAKLATQTAQMAQIGFSFTNPVSFAQQIISSISQEIGDMFDLVSRRAWEAGRYLCNSLLSTALAEIDEDYDADQSDQESPGEVIRPARTVTLVAYSMGCIVIQSCLMELRKIADSMDPRAPVAADLICDVVLIGAPIVGTTEEFTNMRRLVSGRFVNGYVGGDKDLIGRQVRRGFRPFAGCNSFSTVPGIENIPLDEFIHIHAHYHVQMPAILMKIFHGSQHT